MCKGSELAEICFKRGMLTAACGTNIDMLFCDMAAEYRAHCYRATHCFSCCDAMWRIDTKHKNPFSIVC